MIDLGKKSVLGVFVNAIDYEAAVGLIISAAQQKQALSVTALAVHGVMTGVLDDEHRYRLNTFDLITPDGQPVRWALNLLHRTKLSDRVYGPTLMLRVCRAAASAGLSIFLYGSRPEVLAGLRENLCEQYPQLKIAGMESSKFKQLTEAENNEVMQRIKDSGAAITFVGLGCPRQEVWVYENRALLNMPAIAVGAAFDFHAGLLPQCPPQLGRLGLEWLYRLIQEPRRLWRRYLYLNPAYLFLLVLQLLRVRYIRHEKLSPPVRSLRYG